MSNINEAADALRTHLQPHAPREKTPPLPDGTRPAKKAPFKQMAPGVGAKVAVRRGVSGEQRRDRRVVRDVSTDNGTIVVELQPGTGPLAVGLRMLSDAVKGGADGFPVRVMQGSAVVAATAPGVVKTPG